MRLDERLEDPCLEGRQGLIGTGPYQGRCLALERVDRDFHGRVDRAVLPPAPHVQGLQTGVQRPQGYKLQILVGHDPGTTPGIPRPPRPEYGRNADFDPSLRGGIGSTGLPVLRGVEGGDCPLWR